MIFRMNHGKGQKMILLNGRDRLVVAAAATILVPASSVIGGHQVWERVTAAKLVEYGCQFDWLPGCS